MNYMHTLCCAVSFVEFICWFYIWLWHLRVAVVVVLVGVAVVQHPREMLVDYIKLTVKHKKTLNYENKYDLK